MRPRTARPCPTEIPAAILSSPSPQARQKLKAIAAMVGTTYRSRAAPFGRPKAPAAPGRSPEAFHSSSVVLPIASSCFVWSPARPRLPLHLRFHHAGHDDETATLISAGERRPAMNHSIHVMWPGTERMKPMAAKFCAAAVLMPMFQTFGPSARGGDHQRQARESTALSNL